MPRKFSDLQLACAVATSTTIREVCHQLGIVGAGGNYKTVKRRIKDLGLDTSHFKWRRGSSRIPWISDERLREAVAASRSFAGTIRYLELEWSARLLRGIQERCKDEGIDVSHFTGQGWSRGMTFDRPKIPLEEYLSNKRPVGSTSSFKKRLIHEGILDPVCSRCCRTTWDGGPIPLELDHISGDNEDNRLDNLRLLCPNCHALTHNYRGRNQRGTGAA